MRRADEPDAANIDLILASADHPNVSPLERRVLIIFMIMQPKQQEDSFRAQIAVARCLDLPIIVHARDADDDVAAILENEMEKGAFRGVLHCFSSGAELAERAIDIGFYISFSGILTFNKAEELRAIATNIPEDRILVETDSPYLAPVPLSWASKRTSLYSSHAGKIGGSSGQTASGNGSYYPQKYTSLV